MELSIRLLRFSIPVNFVHRKAPGASGSTARIDTFRNVHHLVVDVQRVALTSDLTWQRAQVARSVIAIPEESVREDVVVASWQALRRTDRVAFDVYPGQPGLRQVRLPAIRHGLSIGLRAGTGREKAGNIRCRQLGQRCLRRQQLN